MLTVQSNTSLRALNTFGIDASARYLVEIDNEQDIHTLFQLHGFVHLPKLILGGGSNVLFTQDFAGLVIKINIKGLQRVHEDDAHVWIRAGAGENWHEFVMHCVEQNLAGVENLSLIPGTVGAAPMQNIGAYGVEIKDTFHSLEAIEVATGQVVTFNASTCRFGYRDSIFKQEAKGKFIITHVTFRLNKIPTFHVSYGDIEKTLEQMNVKELSLRAVSEAVIKIRRSKLPDPAEIGNAGSFFKNPEISKAHFDELKALFADLPGYPTGPETVKVPAGWLIEQAGWKGKRLGNVGVHTKQALVLVNYGGGRGLEIRQLSEKIQISVKEKYGIALHAEVNFV